MREPSEAKTIRDSTQIVTILKKLYKASEAIELAIKSQIKFESLENSEFFFDIDDSIIDKALEEDPDFSKIQNLIQLIEGDSQTNFQSKLENERDYISNLDNLIEKNIAKSNFNQKIIKILSSDEDEFPEIASHNQGAQVRESVSQLEPSGAKGASPSSFEKDKQKLMEQLQFIINSQTQTNSISEKLDQLKLVISAISECNTESKFREIEQGINPHISEFLKKLEIKNLEKEIEKKTQHPEKVKKEAEVKAKREAEVKAKREAEVKAKRKAEVKAKKEAEEQAKREAEEQAKREAEEQAKSEAEAKAQKAVAKQQRKAEYEQNKSVDQIIKEVTHELATELAIEERSRLEEDNRIKSKTVADAVNRIENKIIDELLPEYVNEFVEAKTKEKTKIEAEEKDDHQNEITELKARFNLDIKVLEDRFKKEMETFEANYRARMAERDRDKDREIARVRTKLLSENEKKLKELEDAHKIDLEKKLKELEDAHKIDLEKKLKELESSLRDEYEKLLNKKILEEQRKHNIELEEIFVQLDNIRRVEEITSQNFPPLTQGPLAQAPLAQAPLAQAPRLDLAIKETDRAIISELNSEDKILDFLNLSNSQEERVKKLISECYQENSFICKLLQNLNNDYLKNIIPQYKDQIQECISSDIQVIVFMIESVKQDPEKLEKIAQIATLIPTSYNPAYTKKEASKINEDDSHELIFNIITNTEITSSEKIQKLNIVKANTSEESWNKAINKEKKKVTPLQTAILIGDSILAEYFISNYKKIDKLNINATIYSLCFSDKIDEDNKLKILTKLLNLASKPELLEKLNIKSSSNHTLLDYVSEFNENIILKLTESGARLRDCKKLHEFINYAFKSDNFEKFVDNADRNGEGNIFICIDSDCKNLFHYISDNKFNLTSEQISKKFNKLYSTMSRMQFSNSINQIDSAGFSPLDLAIKNNNTEFALELIKKGAYKNNILHGLYTAKNYDMMKVFYEKGLIKFTEFHESIITNLEKTISENQIHADANFNSIFLQFIKEKMTEEPTKIKKLEGSQPNPVTKKTDSSSLDTNKIDTNETAGMFQKQ